MKTDGATLAMNLYNQMNELQIPIFFEEIININKENNHYQVFTASQTLTAKNIILATGREQKKLEIENETKLTGKGISYCATCDGALYKGKNVVVIGSGNSAFEESLYLSNLCKDVTIISRRDEFRADKSLIDEVKSRKNINIITNKIVKKFVGDKKLEAVEIEDRENRCEETISCDGAFIYIGQIPKTLITDKLGVNKERGYIITDETMKTNVKNVYACGDCRKKDLYQLVTASYDGVIAANETIRKKGTS